MPITYLNLVEAYRASHPAQAHALRFALEEAGIRVVIQNEALQDAIGDIPGGWSSAPRIMVEESQLAAARAIIEHHERQSAGLKAHEAAIAMSAATLGIAGVALAPGAAAESKQVEAARCLACNAVMAESENTCPACGWSYETDDTGASL